MLSLSGRSERASYLPPCLHENPCPGLLPVLLYRRWSSPCRVWGSVATEEIAWLLPVPKSFSEFFNQRHKSFPEDPGSVDILATEHDCLPSALSHPRRFPEKRPAGMPSLSAGLNGGRILPTNVLAPKSVSGARFYRRNQSSSYRV